MNKTKIYITLGVVVALVWATAYACSGKKTMPVAKAPVAIEQPVAKAEAPYTVTKTAPDVIETQCKVDPKKLPKKVQPKTKVAPKATPVPQKSSAMYHNMLGSENLPILLPNG